MAKRCWRNNASIILQKDVGQAMPGQPHFIQKPTNRPLDMLSVTIYLEIIPQEQFLHMPTFLIMRCQFFGATSCSTQQP